MVTHSIDQEARDMAAAAKNAIATHELVCAQRWASTMQTMKEIKAILAYGGSVAILVMLAALGLK